LWLQQLWLHYYIAYKTEIEQHPETEGKFQERNMVVLNFAPVFLTASANFGLPSGLSTTMSLNSGTFTFGPQCVTRNPKSFDTMEGQ
jgi:hypothetical protein